MFWSVIFVIFFKIFQSRLKMLLLYLKAIMIKSFFNDEGFFMTKEYILDFLRQNKTLLEEKYHVTKIGLFGSYAKDLATDTSDIDIAIVSNKKDFFLREELREFLEEHFKLKVDLGYFDSIREFYKKRIQSEIIYA